MDFCPESSEDPKQSRMIGTDLTGFTWWQSGTILIQRPFEEVLWTFNLKI